MVFKPINLARQSFVKTFTHGYAQSIVAASQSSSAAQNTPFHSLSNNVVNYFGKSGPTSHIQNVTQPPSSGSGYGAKQSQPDTSGQESGLAAYYAAWHKHQRGEEREWHQFQFAKRIGWKPPTTIPEAPPKNTQDVSASESPARPKVEELGRSYSASALDDLKQQSPEGIAPFELVAVESSTAPEKNPVSAHNVEVLSDSGIAEEISSQDTSLARGDSATFSTSSTVVEPHIEQLTSLAENQRYAEIPAVFESMLIAGITPNASAYNALLLAAINLPRGKHMVVPKVLDVYYDMLQRRVAPDTSTYAILIELLAARAVDVATMKTDLIDRQSRFGGMEEQGSFMFKSDETELKILSEDDSLSLAVKLFDTSAALTTDHEFSADTYHYLISACAEWNRVSDMVRIYADMESRNIVPPTGIFAPMIKAFASVGDLRSAVECYEEYKALAVAHDLGKKDVVRRDEEVYAAVVKAYELCGRLNGGLKFLGRIEEELNGSNQLPSIRDAVTLYSLNPNWFKQNQHSEALHHATENLSVEARVQSIAAICVDAADKNLEPVATEAFGLLQNEPKTVYISRPAMALIAMHIRNGKVSKAVDPWKALCGLTPNATFIEPSTMYALAMIGSGDAEKGLRETRRMFDRIRNQEAVSPSKTEVIDQIDEAIDALSQYLLRRQVVPSSTSSLELIWMMVENGGLVTPLAERLIAGLGPDEISRLSWADLNVMVKVQAGILVNNVRDNFGNTGRFSHLLEIVMANGMTLEKSTIKLVEQATSKAELSELATRWQMYQSPTPAPLASPVQYSAYASLSSPHPVYEDTYDPYASSTDFKGSSMIAEELEKTYGKHSAHLNEALTKFRNMRRIGRHPRYATYAKLIGAAAKENRLSLAHDVLAMAKQDIPMLPHSKVVRHGWISILDSMVGACISLGNRDLAAQYHQEILNMGAAPSANTFGLYITTLKESTKTFDEATEAVKIFHRAKAEGVEPSSFLYNALIGKLGKARRIDDCLFYFAEMRSLGIRPTSVTYGTIVNALCRVSDEKFAEELFEEMESMPNYKPRPAPYNSLMQYFLTTKRDRSKVLAYYERMKAKQIQPTMHTYKLLIDTHATLEPINMEAAENVLEEIRASGAKPEAVHYASLIHAKGCVQRDMAGARIVFDQVIREGLVPPQASIYQAIFESMSANHQMDDSDALLRSMSEQRVAMTPYIANALIHGWATAGNLSKAREVFESLGKERREPSTYEVMTRAYLAAEDRKKALEVVNEATKRGYPAAVANKICELVGGGPSRA